MDKAVGWHVPALPITVSINACKYKQTMIHAREDYMRIQDPENKIGQDEPVFLLRGQDVLAPGLLMKWAEELISRGGDKRLAKSVVSHALKMIEWQEEHGSKLPDLEPRRTGQDTLTSTNSIDRLYFPSYAEAIEWINENRVRIITLASVGPLAGESVVLVFELK